MKILCVSYFTFHNKSGLHCDLWKGFLFLIKYISYLIQFLEKQNLLHYQFKAPSILKDLNPAKNKLKKHWKIYAAGNRLKLV